MKDSCLIIGGGTGMGLGLANEFASHGFNIGLITRRQSVADEIGKKVIDKNQVDYLSIEADLKNFTAIEKGIQSFINQFGIPSLAIYNAAGYGSGNALQQKVTEFMDDLKVSVGGFLAISQFLYPLMEQRGSGSILATGGGISNQPSFDYLSLGVGKTAIEYVVKSIAPAFAQKNIHVGIINIHGRIKADTHFSPDKIAKSFYEMHNEPIGSFTHLKEYK